jgi:hypothetical protein
LVVIYRRWLDKTGNCDCDWKLAAWCLMLDPWFLMLDSWCWILDGC